MFRQFFRQKIKKKVKHKIIFSKNLLYRFFHAEKDGSYGFSVSWGVWLPWQPKGTCPVFIKSKNLANLLSFALYFISIGQGSLVQLAFKVVYQKSSVLRMFLLCSQCYISLNKTDKDFMDIRISQSHASFRPSPFDF